MLTHHTPTIFIKSAAGPQVLVLVSEATFTEFHCTSIASPDKMILGDNVSDIMTGSGTMAASSQDALMYGSGSMTMQVDIQQAQKQRRPSSDSSVASQSLGVSDIFLLYPRMSQARYANAVGLLALQFHVSQNLLYKDRNASGILMQRFP